MGYVFTLRCRISAMTEAAAAPFGIMCGMARQAELPYLAAPGRGDRQEQGSSQKSSDQFAPLKYIATTVSSTTAAASMTVIAETVRSSRGNQLA